MSEKKQYKLNKKEFDVGDSVYIIHQDKICYTRVKRKEFVEDLNWEGKNEININYGFKKAVKSLVYEENGPWIVKGSQYVFESQEELVEYLENNCDYL
jgi:hypothetical protein